MTVETSFIEATGMGVLENWLSRVGVTIARPNRMDFPVDVVAINDDLVTVPIQMKIVLSQGMTVHAKYLGKPLTLIYLFLGDDDGGSNGDHTEMAVLTPEQAWALPRQMNLKHEPDRHITYRWASTTKTLRAELEAFKVRTPEELAARLFPA